MNLPFDAGSLRVLTGDRSRLGPTWGRKTSGDPYGRIYFLRRGRCWILNRRKSTILHAGDLAWIPPGQPLVMGCDGPFHVDWVHVGFEMPPGFLGEGIRACRTGGGAVPFYFNRMQPWLTQLREGKDPTVEGSLVLQGSLLGLVSFFARDPVKGAAPMPKGALRFQKVLGLVRREPETRHSLSELAALVSMSPAGFGRAFARAFGEAPGHYFLREKIHRTRDILRRESRTNRELAARFGFVDEFHFSKTFKRITGETPRQYRERWMRTLL